MVPLKSTSLSLFHIITHHNKDNPDYGVECKLLVWYTISYIKYELFPLNNKSVALHWLQRAERIAPSSPLQSRKEEEEGKRVQAIKSDAIAVATRDPPSPISWPNAGADTLLDGGARVFTCRARSRVIGLLSIRDAQRGTTLSNSPRLDFNCCTRERRFYSYGARSRIFFYIRGVVATSSSAGTIGKVYSRRPVSLLSNANSSWAVRWGKKVVDLILKHFFFQLDQILFSSSIYVFFPTQIRKILELQRKPLFNQSI